VAVIAAAAAGGVVYIAPEAGYFVAGLLASGAVRRVRAWKAGRQGEVDEEEQVDIVTALHGLSPAGAVNVRLTQLQEALGVADTKAVRTLLDQASVPIRSGVRAGGKNGPGVHSDDIPRSCDAPSGGCWCRSDANTNANNDDGEGPREGFRVEAIGQGGVVVHDLSEAHRHHAITT
jgi:hypothetical protein